jgi:hypothetical protein
MRNLLALMILVGSAHAAAAFGVVLTNTTSKTRIEIVDLPDSKDLFLVTWEALPGAIPAGAMVFYKDQGSNETRYFAVGGGGVLSIVDRGGHTLISGTIVPVYDVISHDPDHPAKMVVESGNKLDANVMLAKYGAFEHVAAPSESKAAIEAAVGSAAARLNKTCGAHVAPQLDWDTFVKANKLALAKQAIAIFEALEPLCTDKDYRAGVQALSSVRVEWKTDAGGLALKTGGATLTATFSEASFNPRETAHQWLTNHL